MTRPRILRKNSLGSGHTVILGFVAFGLLSIMAHAGAVTLNNPSPLPDETLDALLTQTDRLMNESKALTLLTATQGQLQPFSTPPEGPLEDIQDPDAPVNLESRIIRLIPPEGAERYGPWTARPYEKPAQKHFKTSAVSLFFLGSGEPLEHQGFEMTRPVKRYRITSRFGWRNGRLHRGIDLSAPMGTPVHAAEDGVIRMARPYYGYGNLIVIDHGNGMRSRYAHLSTLLVKMGEPVYRGQTIGTVGMTGSSTGPHLHFEVLRHNISRNPEVFLLR